MAALDDQGNVIDDSGGGLGAPPPGYIWSVDPLTGLPKLISDRSYTKPGDQDQILTDGTTGRRFRADASGVFLSWMDPAPSGGTTNIVNASTGGSKFQVMYGPEGYGTYEVSTGTPILIGLKASPGGDNPDPDGDGYDNETGLPVGVVREGSGSNVSYWYKGQRVNRDGSLYTGGGETTGGKAQILVDRDGSVTGRAGTSYYFDDSGNPHTLVTGSASSSSSGGGSSSGSSGGSSGGGGSAGGGLTTHAGGYNNTSTSIHEGGYTNTNISEIGPVEAAIRASEFAAQNALATDKAALEKWAQYSRQLSDTDPNAYQVFIDKMGGGRLDNALLSGGNALSENALRGAAGTLGTMNGVQAGGGLQMTTGGGGLQLEGGDPVSPGGGLPSAPAAPPASAYATSTVDPSAAMRAQNAAYAQYINATMQSPEETAYNASQAGKQGAIWGGDYSGRTDLEKYYALTNGIMSGRVAGTQTMDPSRAGYVAPIDPRIAAQAGDDVQRDTTLPYKTVIPQMAGGGLTRAPQMIVGDPQMDGRPNPEMIVNPTNAPISVMPMRNMPPQMAQRAMMPNPMATQRANPMARFMQPQMRAGGGLPRFAYGTPTAEQLAYFNAHPEEDNPFAPAPVAAPTQTAPAPVQQPVAQPVATQPAPAPVATAPTAPVNNPAQIGTYSTAPGTAGQTSTAPTYSNDMYINPGAAGSGQGTGMVSQGGGMTTYTPPPSSGLTTLADRNAPITTPPPPPDTSGRILETGSQGASGGSTQPSQAAFDEVAYTRQAATNPWMADPASYMNVDYGTRDPIARRNYEQWLTMKYGVPQESIAFAQARNRLGGASMASMSQGR